MSLKQDVRVAAKSQPCVSPALCQGLADLSECAKEDDGLDCPGELADEYAESPGMLGILIHIVLTSHLSSRTDEEDDYHPPPSPSPSPSPPSSPSPSSIHSSSFYCEPLRTSRVVRPARTQNRYSPIEAKAPSSRKGKSVSRRVSYDSDDNEPKKPRKRRRAASPACYFCRKRKIACRQPPEGSLDRTCK